MTATTKPSQRELADKAAATKAVGKRYPKGPANAPKAVKPQSDVPLPPPHQQVNEFAQPPPGARLLSRSEVVAKVRLSYPSIWARMNAGTFPRSRSTGGKSLWIESEVDEWINNLPLVTLKCDGNEVD